MNMDSCNCRGMGNINEVEALKDLIKGERISLLLIQETSMELEKALSIVVKVWKQSEGQVISSYGASKGITTF